jgi:hypothetical protein
MDGLRPHPARPAVPPPAGRPPAPVRAGAGGLGAAGGRRGRRPAGDRAIRAVFVPAGGAAVGVARLEVAAAPAGGGWTLTVYSACRQPPRRTPLTAAELRGVVREWGWAALRGRGTLSLG